MSISTLNITNTTLSDKMPLFAIFVLFAKIAFFILIVVPTNAQRIPMVTY